MLKFLKRLVFGNRPEIPEELEIPEEAKGFGPLDLAGIRKALNEKGQPELKARTAVAKDSKLPPGPKWSNREFIVP